jgi:hypothetical protein
MTILQQPILKNPPIFTRVLKKTNNYFEATRISLSIKDVFQGLGNLNFPKSLRNKRG